MRIVTLRLEAFGRFRQHEVGPLHDGLTVIYGPNEAGKSTLLAFIRAVLFGFPKSNSSENRYVPDGSGSHGGQIEVQCSAGKSWLIERQPKGKTAFRVYCEGLAQDTDVAIRRLLGAANKELFQKVFAISLTELQQLETLNEDRVQDALFSAGLGSSGVNSVESRFRAAAADYFKPGAGKSRIGQALAERQDLDRDLKALRRRSDEHGKLSSALCEYGAAIEKLESRMRELSSEHARLQRWTRALTTCAELHELESALGRLELVENFPREGVTRLEALEEGQAQATQAVAHEESLINSLQQKLSTSPPPDAAILGCAAEVERLSEQRGLWEQLCQRLPLMQQQIDQEERGLQRRLEMHGFTGTLTDLATLQISVGLRDSISEYQLQDEQLKARLNETVLQKHSAQAELERRSDARLDLRRTVERLRCGRPELLSIDLNRLHLELHQLKAGIIEKNRLELRWRTALQRWGQALRELGGGWDEDRVHRALSSAPRSEEAGQWMETLEELVRRAEQAQQQKVTAAHLYDEALAREQRLAEANNVIAQPRYGTEELARRVKLAKNLQRTLAERAEVELLVRSHRDRLQNMREEPSDSAGVDIPLMVPALILGLFTLVAALLWWKREPFVAAIVWCSGVGLATMCLALRNDGRRVQSRRVERRDARLTKVEQQLAELECDYADSQLQVDAAHRALDVPGLTAITLPAFLDELAGQRILAERWAAELVAAEIRRTDLQRLRSALSTAHQASDACDHARDAAITEWTEWQTRHHLLCTHPRVQLNVLTRLQQAAVTNVALQELRAEIVQADETTRCLRERLGVLIPCALCSASLAELSDQIENLAAQARAAQEQEAACGEWREKLLMAGQEYGRTEQLRDKFAQTESELEATLRSLAEEFRQLLLREKLPPQLRPATATRVLDALETAQTILATIDQLRADLGATSDSIDSFVRQASGIAALLRVEAPASMEGSAWVTSQVRALQVARQTEQVHKEDEARLRGSLERRSAVEQTRLGFAKRIAELLAAGGSHDTEAFRGRCSQHSEAGRIQAQILERKRSLQLLGVSAEEQSQIVLTSSEQLSRALEAVAHEREEVELEAVGLRERRTKCSLELEGLERSEEIARHSLRAASLDAQIHSDAMLWAKNMVAAHLVQLARETFQRERQPDVIRRAQSHFCAMTDGQYPHLYTVLGTRDLAVESLDKKRREPAHLSRGTAEQLYLALRLGFIEDFCGRSEPLPVVLDDIFVNFDDDRAHNTMKLLSDFARQHQVVLFTCHRSTVERARLLCSDCTVIELAS